MTPKFLSATFAVERDAQLAGLRQDADEVVVFARKLVRRKFFGSHPLAIDANGDEAGVQALTPGDLAALHRRLLVGGNAVLAVAGDFDPERLAPKLKAFLARLPAGRATEPPAGPWNLPASPGEFVEKQPREQAVVFQAFPGPPLSSEDYFTSEVADELFSGMASRLFERVREEKGLAYFVRAARVVGVEVAAFIFYAGTQPGKEKDVLAEIDAEIARVQGGGVEEPELQRCQVRLQTARREGLQTNGSRAAQASLDVLLGRPANDWKRYDERIRAVTRDELAGFARKYFVAGRRVQLVVRP
jgi:zinc protease